MGPSAERLFTNQVFQEESRTADETYAQSLRRKQDIEKTLNGAAYVGLTYGGAGLTVLATWKIGEFAGNDIVSGNLEKIWMYPAAIAGVVKGQNYIFSIARKFRQRLVS